MFNTNPLSNFHWVKLSVTIDLFFFCAPMSIKITESCQCSNNSFYFYCHHTSQSLSTPYLGEHKFPLTDFYSTESILHHHWHFFFLKLHVISYLLEQSLHYLSKLNSPIPDQFLYHLFCQDFSKHPTCLQSYRTPFIIHWHRLFCKSTVTHLFVDKKT